MALTSTGRGAIASLGLFVLFAGLVGGGVLYVVSQQRPSQAVDGFARAPIGCTTTLEFSDAGTFYVFEEAGAVFDSIEGGCQPRASSTSDLEIEFTGDLRPATLVADATIDYDVDGFDGRSMQRVEITEPGEYTVEVTGRDLTVVAALGRDPHEGVDDLRRNGLLIAIVGTVIGLALLTLAGRRSKRAAVTPTIPDGPVWNTPSALSSGGASPPQTGPWPGTTPRPPQVPINPHQPPQPVHAELPATPTAPSRPDWAAPTGEPKQLPAPDPAQSGEPSDRAPGD